MAYSLDQLRDNVQVKCEFLMKDEHGKNLSRICTLRELEELSSYERTNLVGLVVFPMKRKNTKDTFPTITSRLENFIKDFPSLRTLAVSHQWANEKKDLAEKIKKAGCPSLGRCIFIKSELDESMKDFRFKDATYNNTFTNREQDSKYFCNLISGGADNCEIVNIYDTYDFPKEKKQRIPTEETLKQKADKVIATLEVKINGIKQLLGEENDYIDDFQKYLDCIKENIYGYPEEKVEEIFEAVKKVNLNISKDALKKAIPELVEEKIPTLFAPAETLRGELIEELLRKTQKIESFESLTEENWDELETDWARIILSDDKIFHAYMIENSLQNSQEKAFNWIQSDIDKSFSTMPSEMVDVIKKWQLPEEMSSKMAQVLQEIFLNRKESVIGKVKNAISDRYTIKDIAKIVENSVKNLNISEDQLGLIKNEVVSAVTQTMGDISKLTEEDLTNISNVVGSKLESLNIENLQDSVAGIKKDLSEIPSKKYIDDKFKALEDLIKETNNHRAVVNQPENNNNNNQNENILEIIFKFIKDNNVSKNQIDQLFNSQFGIIISGINQANQTIQNNIIAQLINQGSNNPVVNNVTNINGVVQNILQTYMISNMISQTLHNNYMSLMGGSQFNNTIGIQSNAITNILMMSMLGLGANQNFVNMGAPVQNNSNLDQSINMLKLLLQILQAYQNGQSMNNQVNTQTEQEDNQNTNPDSNQQDNVSNATENENIEPNEKPVEIKLPEKNKKFEFKKQSIEDLEKLAEPKNVNSIRSKIARHPVRTALVIAGVGAVAGVGVALLSNVATLASAIGFGAKVSALLPEAGVGAGIGALVGGATGGIGGAIAGVIDGVKRERLHKKFVKSQKKAEKSLEKVKDLQAEEEQQNQKVQELRENLKNAKSERQRNKTLKTLAKKRKNIRKVKEKIDKKHEKYGKLVQKALDTKSQLNEIEEKTNKSTALAGTLQYLKNKREDVAKGKISEEDYAGVKKSVETELSDLTGNKVDLDKVNIDNHKTFDKEASDLIESISEMKRTNEMNATLEEIKNRHKAQITEKAEISQYDPKDIAKLQAEVTANPTQENLQKFASIKKEFDKINETIKDTGATPQDPTV